MNPWLVISSIVSFLWVLASVNLGMLMLSPTSHFAPVPPDRLHDFLAAAGFCCLNLWNLCYLLNRKLVNVPVL